MALSDLEPKRRKDLVLDHLGRIDGMRMDAETIGAYGEETLKGNINNGIGLLAEFAEAERHSLAGVVIEKVQNMDEAGADQIQKGLNGIVGSRLLEQDEWTAFATDFTKVEIDTFASSMSPHIRAQRTALNELLNMVQTEPIS